MNRVFTKICKNHPELLGERFKHNRVCVGCNKKSNKARAKKKYGSDPVYRAKVIATVVKYGQANVEARRARANSSYAKNKESYRDRRASQGALRRGHQKIAQPVWVNVSSVKAFYAMARASGQSVDHIVPLRGRNVCGLHVPWNLTVIPLIENCKKGNRYG